MDLLEITENTKRHPWETARKKIINRLISDLHKKGMNILDIGSGDAYLADNFTREFQDCRAFCVDTSYTADITEMIGNTYRNKNLELYSSLSDVKAGRIDVVTLLDVIEHVPDDVGFIQEIIKRPYIHSDTIFVISVPAYQILFSRHDVMLKHYRRYNLKGLKRTASSSQLKVLNSGYFFGTLIIPRVIQQFSEKLFSRSEEEWQNLGNWNDKGFKTKIIESVLMIDYRIGRMFKSAGVNLPGLSCYVICKARQTDKKIGFEPRKSQSH
jgi:2-polyprenyl-3-methyl-5-hydroxy-6-metoxy-1,4-benzoquinol methylase